MRMGLPLSYPHPLLRRKMPRTTSDHPENFLGPKNVCVTIISPLATLSTSCRFSHPHE
ncbi:hypothetical protein BSAE_1882 [Bifidobacterium pullorum subsp. saeculare DSM 6531 = LMG 14934]|uniref:Uncharacterized protein n=1 Tax=Bifidobacterium pullorum subsp. saeculare DSM 6531 = LMG 14934 TaxID=1437611 RepID=A0A087CPV5_9BIFI|nr:hypothetical protein BSAE_1882 [Bifidobacterium pullorum subsp. saeculare DSM 6531 = LMG 14934]